MLTWYAEPKSWKCSDSSTRGNTQNTEPPFSTSSVTRSRTFCRARVPSVTSLPVLIFTMEVLHHTVDVTVFGAAKPAGAYPWRESAG